MVKIEDLGLNEEQTKAIETLIQSESDKIRTKYVKELDAVKAQLSEFSNKQEEVEQLRKSLEAERQKLELSKKLKERNLPAELGDYLTLGDDVDSSLDTIAKAITDYSMDNVDSPKTHTRAATVTKEDFRQMSFLQRLKIKQENPALYTALAN